MWATINEAFNTAVNQLQGDVYWLTLVYLFLSEFGMPIPLPGNVVLVAGGFLLGRSGEWPFLLMLLAFMALVPGAAGLFLVGRKGGQPLLARVGHRIGLPPERRERIAHWLGRRAVLGLIIVRLLPTVRVGTTLLPGAMGMPTLRYALGMGCALSAWVGLYIVIGFGLGIA